MTDIMLIGNPNCGKTTLFNALTGEHQSVGNWPGVTVEKKIGTSWIDQKPIQVIDLPGIYALETAKAASSEDTRIASTAVTETTVDILVNVIDACHLERHLYLTSQLLELGQPTIVVLTMMDRALKQGIHIDLQALSRHLQCPVIAVNANDCHDLNTLKQTLSGIPVTPTTLALPFPEWVQQALVPIEHSLTAQGHTPAHAAFLARRQLEQSDMDVLIADTRYQWVHEGVQQVLTRSSDQSERLTAKIDRVVLHRVLALPVFFTIMYGMFFFAVRMGSVFQTFFERTSETVFLKAPAWLLQQLHAPDWLVRLMIQGLFQGLQTTLTFVPVLMSMFFVLSLLESSGYMARAAFVMDRAMRWLGLPGKAFVPMIVGFGCNVPAIMGTRILDSKRDRILAALMSPFMSCGARLAIYAVFVTAFFPKGGENVVFSLYVIGIVLALFTGWMLRKTLLSGDASPFILELPPYQRPNFKALFHETGRRLRAFILRAARLIVPVSMALGLLNDLHLPHQPSMLAMVGHTLTPLFAPMGLHADNWPATVSLLTGMFAKEVVIGSLNHFYSTMQNNLTSFDLFGSMQTIPDATTYHLMQHSFGSSIAAYAYLLFILLYIPCVSTMAAIRQETNRFWMMFSIIWSLMIAYSASVLFYQCATFEQHPQQTLKWVVAIGCLFIALFFILRTHRFSSGEPDVAAIA